MRSIRFSSLTKAVRRHRLGALTTAVLAAAALVVPVALPTAGAAPAPAGDTGSAQPAAGASPVTGAGETHEVTLLTGDVVILQIAPGGQQSAWIEKPAHPDGTQLSPQIYEQDGQVHVVPAEAAPYLKSGALDQNLFNVTLLARQGLSDEAQSSLPLLLQSRGGPSGALPAVPNGARRVRTLDSIASVSVTADKAQIRTVWDSLRGLHPAAVNSTNARLATAGRVWLNGMVRATAQAGVTQIGAPSAWAAGYNGKGVHVAVLDTGYDPTHPDLAGRVTKERNFTADQDPPGETAVDGNGHGTHVAATIAGTGKASGGAYEGVAPGADLWIGKVLGNNGSGPEDQIIAGMQWAAESGADIINMSVGSPGISDGTEPMSQAVNQLSASTGALFVVAAGNAGPGEQTVTSPGSADLALTVGAVDGSDHAASFSSRGPRFGDLAIKPEVVAPGVDVVSARAAGTSEGNLLDSYYTTLSGTSMATPHVAGAAAILAQEHPSWNAAELKAQLVATSKTLPDQPVTFQGAGRVDVAAAVADPVTVDQAVLSLGHVAQGAGPVTRTLTYSNPTGKAVALRLSAQVRGSGVDESVKPQLAFDRNTLTVPAHGTASARVTLSPGQTGSGMYAGQLLAEAAGRPNDDVHSVISFAVDGPSRTVTVNAVDRSGKPAAGFVDLWNEDTGDYNRAWLADGTVTTQVPDGTYTLMTTMGDSQFLAVAQTVAGDLDQSIHSDLVLSYDARDGQPVTVDTPREADLDSWGATWTRTVGGRSLTTWAANGTNGQQLYVIAGKKARQGSFAFATQWQLTQPMLTARISGGARVSPNPSFASLHDPFVGSRTLPLVYAGAGTADEFAAVDARGKIALVTRSDAGLLAQVQAAKAAGAALLMVQNTQPGPWREDLFRPQGLPTYRLDQAAGAQLRQALAANPALTLDVTGISDSTYNYELVFPESALPSRPSYHVDQRSLATVVSDYRQNSARMVDRESWIPHISDLGVGDSMAIPRNGPVVRTEYLSTNGVSWQRFAQPHELANMYWTWSDSRQYEAGDTEHQLWWGPLIAPGVPPISGAEQGGAPVARFRDAIRILVPHYYYGGTRYGYIQNQMGDTSELELRRGGEVVGKATWPVAQFTVPADRAEYELSLSVQNGSGNFADTSVRTESTWRFESARSSTPRTVLPLVQLQYDVDANGYNEVAAGTAYPLTVTPAYQPGASGPGQFTVTAQVSYDDGTTWSNAQVHSVNGQFRAMMPAAAAPGFATVRVVATDAAGNRLTQQIDRAWRIGS